MSIYITENDQRTGDHKTNSYVYYVSIEIQFDPIAIQRKTTFSWAVFGFIYISIPGFSKLLHLQHCAAPTL